MIHSVGSALLMRQRRPLKCNEIKTKQGKTRIIFQDCIKTVLAQKIQDNICLVKVRALDPKLLITDPDPQNENQEFRIRNLDPDPSVNKFCLI